MKKSIVVGTLMLAGLFSGCSIFRSKMPDYVLYNIGQDDHNDWSTNNLSHPKVWAENIHRMMLNSSMQPMTHSHWAMDGAIHGVRGAIEEMEALEKDGAKFKVAVGASGKFSFQVLKPAASSGVLDSAVARYIPFGNKEATISIMLNNVGRGARQLQHDSIPGIEKLYFDTATEIAEMKQGKELSFDLPQGVSRENYMEVLDCLLMSYRNDLNELQTYQAALASTLAALAALDSDRRGSVGNIYLVLGAALEDREKFEKERKSLEIFPPQKERLAQLRAEATKVQKEVVEGARYKAWQKESHAMRHLSNFGAEVVEAFGSLSEVYGAMGGIDIVGGIQERIAKGLEVGDMLDVGLRLAPAGSRMQSVIQTGKNVYSTGEKVAEAGQAAGQLKRIDWASVAEVAKAKERVIALQPSH